MDVITIYVSSDEDEVDLPAFKAEKSPGKFPDSSIPSTSEVKNILPPSFLQSSKKRQRSNSISESHEDQLNKYIKLDADHDLIPNSNNFVCMICSTEVLENDGVILRDCLHEFCKGCLTSYIEHCDKAEVPCPYADNNFNCSSILRVAFHVP